MRFLSPLRYLQKGFSKIAQLEKPLKSRQFTSKGCHFFHALCGRWEAHTNACQIHINIYSNSYICIQIQNHVFKRDARFMIIEKIEKENVENITQLLETHEDNLIKRLLTLSPKGLNNKLNHPDKY